MISWELVRPLFLISEVFFKILIILFLDTLSQQIFFLIIKINNFWGDLSGISAKTATLFLMYLFTTVPHPHGHWQLQELLGNQTVTGNVNIRKLEQLSLPAT